MREGKGRKKGEKKKKKKEKGEKRGKKRKKRKKREKISDEREIVLYFFPNLIFLTLFGENK